MKRIILVLVMCACWISGICGAHTFSTLLDKDDVSDRSLFKDNDEKSKLEDDNTIWEKQSEVNTENEQLITKDDDTKLFAPPKGDTGNPQKIAAPLGSGEMLFFLLLSILVIGRCLYRKSKLAV